MDDHATTILDGCNFGVTVTAYETATTLDAWLREHRSTQDKYGMFFQVFCASFLLHARGIVHHDLHFGNILVQPLERKKVMYCRLGTDREYCLAVQAHPLLYDYDFAQVMGPEKPGASSRHRACLYDEREDVVQLCLMGQKYGLHVSHGPQNGGGARGNIPDRGAILDFIAAQYTTGTTHRPNTPSLLSPPSLDDVVRVDLMHKAYSKVQGCAKVELSHSASPVMTPDEVTERVRYLLPDHIFD